MPIYEYRCPDCGHQFDAIQKFSDAPITDCPSCQGGAVKKLLSAPAFHLKGGGWYKDHYGLKGGDASDGSTGASSAASAGGASDGGGSDSGASTSSSAASSSDGGGSSSAGASSAGGDASGDA